MLITRLIYITIFVTFLSASSCESQAQQAAQRHVDQAFSYIAAMQVTSDEEQLEKLSTNAEVEFTKALEYQPANFMALMNRGVLYVSMGKLNKAAVDYRAALAVEPLNPDLHFNLACLHALEERDDLALDALNTALQQGFNDVSRMRQDPDLQNIRSSAEFSKILETNKFFL